MIAATGRLVSLEAARRRRLQRTRRTGRSVAPWPWSPGAFLVLANERSRKPLGNQNVPDVAATRLQDTATAGKSAHQTAQYVARTRAGNGRIIEVTGLDQLADAPERLLAELLLAGTTGALCVRSDKSGQVHRPAVGDDGVAFDDTNLLWIDEGRRSRVCRRQRYHKDRQKPQHGMCPVQRTPYPTLPIVAVKGPAPGAAAGAAHPTSPPVRPLAG